MHCSFFTSTVAVLPAPCRFGKPIFAATSPYLLLLYLLWLVDAYVATALDGLVAPPPVLQSIGIWGYSRPFPAVLPLLLHLATAVAVAGLSCSRTIGSSSSSDRTATAGTEGSSSTEQRQREVGGGAAAATPTAGIFLPAAVIAAAGLPDLGLGFSGLLGSSPTQQGLGARGIDGGYVGPYHAAIGASAPVTRTASGDMDECRSDSGSGAGGAMAVGAVYRDAAGSSSSSSVAAAGRELLSLVTFSSRMSQGGEQDSVLGNV